MQEFENGRNQEKEAEAYGKPTRPGAITAGTAGNPQAFTSSVNLHVEFFWRRAQFDFGIIKPEYGRIEDEQKSLTVYTTD